jgi:L-histidine N-alpha-methyltransferase
MTPASALPVPSVLPAPRRARPQLRLVHAPASPLAIEVKRGLTARRKFLSPWVFYDAAGSELFERITELPEYYLTRAERGIFAARADEVFALAAGDQPNHAQPPLHILELGAGSAAKTGLLLAAAVRAQGRVLYQPIDVSSSALKEAQRNLEAQLPGVEVEPYVSDYTRGYDGLTRPAGPRLALFIGSSVGNFEPADALQVLRDLRAQLQPGDSFLLGADLRKDPAILLPAYDDAEGVTAAFNKNALARINRELGGEFQLDLFGHEARWNSRLSRVEMHLVSLREQKVRIAGLKLAVNFTAGETIHTENSYKYTPARLAKLLRQAGFAPQRRFLVTFSDALPAKIAR